MKVKNIVIGIQSPEEGAREFVHAVRSIRRNKPVHERKDGTYFTSLKAMRQVLTPKRLELLHLVREKHPGSIYELARMCGRDLKNVQDDIAMLSRIGLVSLTHAKQARERIIPQVGYDRLNLHIPII